MNRGGPMSNKSNPLSLHIPWLLEAVTEGPLAIMTLFVLAIILIVSKSLGLW